MLVEEPILNLQFHDVRFQISNLKERHTISRKTEQPDMGGWKRSSTAAQSGSLQLPGRWGAARGKGRGARCGGEDVDVWLRMKRRQATTDGWRRLWVGPRAVDPSARQLADAICQYMKAPLKSVDEHVTTLA
nr:unnamed protein product [Digitaria exilis]